ncbi:RNA-binding, CRM domain containing protein [Trema orientale]|uniref:RNA-binding, CRM domain containing protein n=1 Tax=Trema orientale TaxID=63057 RepID=A0A2P5FPY8_TREOI|nr:RNA-binding, CRM domain containing protein [Trema orientale]
MAAAPGAVSYLLHHILHRPPPSPPSSCFLKPLLLISTVSSSKDLLKCATGLSHRRHESTITLFPSLLSHRLPPRLNSSTGSLSLSVEKEAELEDDNDNGDDDEAQELEIEDYHEDGDGDDDEEEEEEEEEKEESEKVDMAEGSKVGLDSLRVRTQGMKLPSLTVKEKKELASYAHSLGKKLKSQLVGKSGVTASVAASFVENLESNELLKIKIHRTCPGELDDVVKQLEEATGSVVVSEIGRTVILYRPSLTKLKAEEKKKENQKIFMRRKLRAKPAFQMNGARPRLSGRGRRGSSRF